MITEAVHKPQELDLQRHLLWKRENAFFVCEIKSLLVLWHLFVPNGRFSENGSIWRLVQFETGGFLGRSAAPISVAVDRTPPVPCATVHVNQNVRSVPFSSGVDSIELASSFAVLCVERGTVQVGAELGWVPRQRDLISV